MLSGFLFALFLIQAGPPQPVGIVSGIVRGDDGKPVQGTRVFAVALRDTAEAATAAAVLESLAQTDESGRYRLEVPPGRYLIACGSVAVPTYFPGTTIAADARPVTVAPGAQINGVDFASFVAPQPLRSFSFSLLNPYTPSNSGPTTISGEIRLQDGDPAKGMEVIAIPVPRSPTAEVSSRSIPVAAILRGRTDDLGRYLLVNVPPGRYYIVSGTKDLPIIYPGTPDLAKAVPVTVMPSQPVSGKDFSVSGVSVSGRVAAAGGMPAIGAWIRVRLSNPSTKASGPASLMFGVSLETSVDSDGSYSVGGLSPGAYIVETGAEGLTPQVRNVTVGDQAIKGIDFSLPMATVAPGQYQIDIAGLPPDVYVASIRYGAQEVRDSGILVGGEVEAPSKSILKVPGATVTGPYGTIGDEAAADRRVVIVPQSNSRDAVGMPITTATDQQGTFSLRGLAPGGCVVFAFNDTQNGIYNDLAYQERFQSSGTGIRLENGASTNLNLRLIDDSR